MSVPRSDRFAPSAPRRKLSLNSVKPKRWSHQNDLDQAKGKQVDVIFLTGSHTTGELLESDQFTLKLRVDSPPGTVRDLVLFKSGLSLFRVAE